jgi:uncharacterized protein with LGFP repeats
MARYSHARRATPVLAAIVVCGLLAGAASLRPTAAAAASCPTIAQEYHAVGAAKLGQPTSKTLRTAAHRGLYRRYQHGEIWWTKRTCAHALGGDILLRWKNAGGTATLGYPTTDVKRSRFGPAALYSRFENGEIYSLPGVLLPYQRTSAPTYEVHGAIYRRWAASGYETGFLGYPAADEQHAGSDGAVVRFSGGAIYESSSGVYAVHGSIYAKYRQMNEWQGPLGYPVEEEQVTGQDGLAERFEQGMIASSPRGTYEVHGTIYDNYLTAGRAGTLGLPVGDERDLVGGSTSATASQKYRGHVSVSVFEHGAIVAWPNGVWAVYDPLYTRWQRMGGVNGPLGLPIDNPNSVDGLGQHFQGGRLFTTNLSNPEQTASFCNTSGPGCDNASPPPVIGYSEYDLYNCNSDGHALSIWARDVTAGTSLTMQATVMPSVDSYGSCPAISDPVKVKLTPAGHQFEIIAVDPQRFSCSGNSPMDPNCQVWRDVVSSNTAGPAASVYAF